MFALPAGKLSRRTLLIGALIGIAFSLALILHFSLKKPDQNNSASTPFVKQEKISYGLPRRLKIPKISVDATVEHVGVTSEGDMAVPKSPDNTAWYNPGSRPGEIGSAVINGHYGWVNSTPAIFDNLHNLQ